MKIKKLKITKKTKLSGLLKKRPDVAIMLMEKGMHCIGCPASLGENLEEAALAHGISPEELIKEIKNYLISIA